MGYYPFGSKLFTDLTHYVRSVDFIEALLEESQDINEYAFALGALAHYAADNMLKDVFADPDLAIGSYRRAASVIIPKMTQVAWETKKGEIEKLTPGITQEKFIYNLAHADYEREWGKQYDKPDFEDKLLAFFIRIIPRVGPLKTLSFKPITPETERLFLDSFEATIEEYRALLRRAQPGRLDLVNMNFDLGRPTRAGEYRRADEAYNDLLTKLAKNEFNNVTPGLRKNILAFFRDLNAPIATKKDSGDWRKIVLALDKLKAAQAQTRRTVRR